MEFKYLKVRKQGSVFELLLNRPDVLNSFNRQMSLELQQVLWEAAQDKQVRAVLLSGEGRAFCAGQDLAEVAPGPDGTLPELGEIVRTCYNPVVLALRQLEKPVVCAVNGVAAGAGANIALACDFVLASYATNFVQSFVQVGLIPDSGGTFFLPRLVGLARANALCMLGDKISAQQAEQIGLIYRACTPQTLINEARALAERLAGLPTRGIGLTKRAFNSGFYNSINAQLEFEAELQAEAGASNDYKEGVLSFLHKRKPQFKGE